MFLHHSSQSNKQFYYPWCSLGWKFPQISTLQWLHKFTSAFLIIFLYKPYDNNLPYNKKRELNLLDSGNNAIARWMFGKIQWLVAFQALIGHVPSQISQNFRVLENNPRSTKYLIVLWSESKKTPWNNYKKGRSLMMNLKYLIQISHTHTHGHGIRQSFNPKNQITLMVMVSTMRPERF